MTVLYGQGDRTGGPSNFSQSQFISKQTILGRHNNITQTLYVFRYDGATNHPMGDDETWLLTSNPDGQPTKTIACVGGRLNNSFAGDWNQTGAPPANTPGLIQIAAGTWDAEIDKWADALKVVPGRVWMRLWREMNNGSGPWYDAPSNTRVAGSAVNYVNAWRRVHARFQARGATNVDFLWCPMQGGVGGPAHPGADGIAWYPGDAYVDWVGCDGYADSGKMYSLDQLFDNWYKAFNLTDGFAGRKPLIICETAPAPSGGTSPVTPSDWLNEWPAWLASHPSVQAVAFWNEGGHPCLVQDGATAATQATYLSLINSPPFTGTTPTTVIITAPTPGIHFADGDDVAVSADVAPGTGLSITGVTSKLDAAAAVAMTNTSGTTWTHDYGTGLATGSHTLLVTATDNHGATTQQSVSFTVDPPVVGGWTPTYDLRDQLVIGTLNRSMSMQVRSMWSASDGGTEAVRVANEARFVSSGTYTPPYIAQMVAANPDLFWASYQKSWQNPVSGDAAATKFPSVWYAKYKDGSKVQQGGTYVNWLMELGKNPSTRQSASVGGVTETAWGPWHVKQILADYATQNAKYGSVNPWRSFWFDSAGSFSADNAPGFWDALVGGNPGWNPGLARPYGQPPIVNNKYTDKGDLLDMLWWKGELCRNQVATWSAINSPGFWVAANGAGGAGGGGSGNPANIAQHFDMAMCEGWTHKFGTILAGPAQADAEATLQLAIDVQSHGSIFQALDWAQGGYTAAQYTQFRRVSAAANLICQRTGAGCLFEFGNTKADNPALETARDPSLFAIHWGSPLHEPAIVAANYPTGHRAPVGSAAGQASAVGLLKQEFDQGTAIWNYTTGAITYHADRSSKRVPDLQNTAATSYASGAAVVIPAQSAMFLEVAVVSPVAPTIHSGGEPVVSPSGSSVVGTILATTNGTWDGTLPMTPDYQWQLSADGSTGWANVTGATGAQFNTTGHLGMYARCGVRMTNVAGVSTRVFSASVGPFVDAAVAPSWATGSSPTISGEAIEGTTLTAIVGTTQGNPPPTAAYQWQQSSTGLANSWTNLLGETAATLDLPVGSAGTYRRVTITLSNGVLPDAVKSSLAVGPITTPPATLPNFTSSVVVPYGGAPRVGRQIRGVVTGETGTLPVVYTYQWQRLNALGGGNVDIPGATGEYYTPVTADVGGRLWVLITGTNTAGAITFGSLATEIVLGPTLGSATARSATSASAVGRRTRKGSASSTSATRASAAGTIAGIGQGLAVSRTAATLVGLLGTHGTGSGTSLTGGVAHGLVHIHFAGSGSGRSATSGIGHGEILGIGQGFGVSATLAAARGHIVTPPIPPPVPTPQPVPPTLGCGLYDVYILDRGGQVIRQMISTWTSVKWSRVPGAASSGSVDLSGLSSDAFVACCASLADVLPWADELALYRRRDGEAAGTLVWCGPIGPSDALELSQGKAVIPAQDLYAWFDVRFVHHDYGWVNADLAEIAHQLARDALEPDPSPQVAIVQRSQGQGGAMEILANDYVLAGEKLRSLVEQGLQASTVRRTVTFGPVTGEMLLFTDSMFAAPPQIKLFGGGQASRVAVTGQAPATNDTGDQTPAPSATSSDAAAIATYGLVERVSQTDATTLDAVQQDADVWIGEVGAPVAIVEQGTLRQDAPIQIEDLVPGRRCHLRLSDQCYKIDGAYDLGLVEVTAGAGKEQVTVHFTPSAGGLA